MKHCMLCNSEAKDYFIIMDQQTVLVLSHYKGLKGTVSRDFLFLVFFMNQFPQAPEYSIETDSNFFKNSRRYSQVKVHTGGKFFHQFH
jgi:hypothetical protein